MRLAGRVVFDRRLRNPRRMRAGGEPVRLGDWFLPWSMQIVGELACESKLGVGGHDDPGPAVALVGLCGCAAGCNPGLLEESEGVFQVEAVEEGSPQTVHLRVVDLGAGIPQPHRFGAAITRQSVHVQPDDAALDDRQWAVVRFPRRAVSQPRVQPVSRACPGSVVAAGVGEGDRIGLGLGRGLGQRELGAVLGRASGGCWAPVAVVERRTRDPSGAGPSNSTGKSASKNARRVTS